MQRKILQTTLKLCHLETELTNTGNGLRMRTASGSSGRHPASPLGARYGRSIRQFLSFLRTCLHVTSAYGVVILIDRGLKVKLYVVYGMDVFVAQCMA